MLEQEQQPHLLTAAQTKLFSFTDNDENFNFTEKEVITLLDLVEKRFPTSETSWAEIAWALYMLYPVAEEMKCGDACRRKFRSLCKCR